MLVISNLFALAVLLVAVGLTWDGVATIRRWRGVRLAGLAPSIAFALATVASVAYLAILWFSPNRLGVFGISLLALPILVALILACGRNVRPHDWTTAGEWEWYRTEAIDIPLPNGAVPALYYVPTDPASAAVVLLHGAGAHKSFYSWPLVDGLLEAGIAVCAIDIDGHGDSHQTLDYPAVLENVAAPVRWLRARHTWVGAVGVSLGGCIAARAVAEGADVDALALLEAPADAQVNRRATRHERWTVMRRATWGLHRYAGTVPLITGWRTAPTRSHIGTLDLIRRLNLVGSVATMPCPLLLLYGTSDLVVPIAQARAIAEAAPAGTPFNLIAGATHLSLPIDPRAIRILAHWLGTFAAYGSLKESPSTGS